MGHFVWDQRSLAQGHTLEPGAGASQTTLSFATLLQEPKPMLQTLAEGVQVWGQHKTPTTPACPCHSGGPLAWTGCILAAFPNAGKHPGAGPHLLPSHGGTQGQDWLELETVLVPEPHEGPGLCVRLPQNQRGGPPVPAPRPLQSPLLASCHEGYQLFQQAAPRSPSAPHRPQPWSRWHYPWAWPVRHLPLPFPLPTLRPCGPQADSTPQQQLERLPQCHPQETGLPDSPSQPGWGAWAQWQIEGEPQGPGSAPARAGWRGGAVQLGLLLPWRPQALGMGSLREPAFLPLVLPLVPAPRSGWAVALSPPEQCVPHRI
uniref:uncharacterized protein LOC128930538 n=1 Tax=Callithrix jacchus TaxID=9483 RepID=UPI0023DD49F1|nr:uncharacterized protein LOC128930538 [Callithrix jacchus]